MIIQTKRQFSFDSLRGSLKQSKQSREASKLEHAPGGMTEHSSHKHRGFWLSIVHFIFKYSILLNNGPTTSNPLLVSNTCSSRFSRTLICRGSVTQAEGGEFIAFRTALFKKFLYFGLIFVCLCILCAVLILLKRWVCVSSSLHYFCHKICSRTQVATSPKKHLQVQGTTGPSKVAYR